MDASEFTTLDEIGEDEASKVKVSVIESRPKFKCAAEEIDYLNKVLQGLEKNSNDSCANSVCDKNQTSDCHSEQLIVDSKSKNNCNKNLSSTSTEHGQHISCDPSSNYISPNHINNNSEINELAIEPFPEVTTELSPEKSNLSAENKIDETIPSSSLENNSDDICLQPQSVLGSVPLCIVESSLSIKNYSLTEDCKKYLSGSNLTTAQEFNDISTFPIPLSDIKTESLDTGEASMEDYFADPAEECNLTDIGAIKEEFMAATPESQQIPSNLPDNDDNNISIFGKPIKIETISLHCSVFQLPKVHFKIRQNLFYTKEELDAAMLMTTSSLARIMHMDMFAEHRNSFPKIKLFKLEEAEKFAASILDDDMDVLIPFINTYGSKIHKWKKIFRIKRNYARKRSKHKSKKSPKSKKSGKSIQKQYKDYYKKLNLKSPSPVSDIDFEGFPGVAKEVDLGCIKSNNELGFDNSSDSDDVFKINVDPCLSLLQSPMKGSKLTLLNMNSIQVSPMKERETNKAVKHHKISIIGWKECDTLDVLKTIHNIKSCYVRLLSLEQEILAYETDFHLKKCKTINCDSSCKYTHKLRHPSNLLSSQTYKSKNDTEKVKNKPKFEVRENSSSLFDFEKNSKSTFNDNSKNSSFVKPMKDSSFKIENDKQIIHKKDDIRIKISDKLFSEQHDCPKIISGSMKDRTNNVKIKSTSELETKEYTSLKIETELKHVKFKYNMSKSKLGNILQIDNVNITTPVDNGGESSIEICKTSHFNRPCPKSKQKIKKLDNAEELLSMKSNTSKECNNVKSSVETNLNIADKFETDKLFDIVVKPDIILPTVSNDLALSEGKDTIVGKSPSVVPVQDTSVSKVIFAKDTKKDQYHLAADVATKSLNGSNKKSSVVHALHCKSCSVSLKNILFNQKYRKLVKKQLSAVMRTSSLSNHAAEAQKMVSHHQKHRESSLQVRDVKSNHKQKHHERKTSEIAKQHNHSTPNIADQMDKLKHKQGERRDRRESKFVHSKDKKEDRNITRTAEDITKSSFRIPKKHKSISSVPCQSSLIDKRNNSKFSLVPTYKYEKKKPPQPEGQIRSFNIGEKFKSQSVSSGYKVPPIAYTSTPGKHFQKTYLSPTEVQGISSQSAVPHQNISSTTKSHVMSSDAQSVLPHTNIQNSQVAAHWTSSTSKSHVKSSNAKGDLSCWDVPLATARKQLYFPKGTSTSTLDNLPLPAAAVAKTLDRTDAKRTHTEKILDLKYRLDDISKSKCPLPNTRETSERLDHSCSPKQDNELAETVECMSIGGQSSSNEGQASEEQFSGPPKPNIPMVLSAKDKLRSLVSSMSKKEKHKMYIKYKTRYNESLNLYNQIPGGNDTNISKYTAYKDMRRKKKLYYDLKIFLLQEKNSTRTVAKPQPKILPLPTLAPKSHPKNSNDEPYSPSHSPVLKHYKLTKISVAADYKLSPSEEIELKPESTEEDVPYSPSGPISDTELYSPGAPICNEESLKALNSCDESTSKNISVNTADQRDTDSDAKTNVSIIDEVVPEGQIEISTTAGSDVVHINNKSEIATKISMADQTMDSAGDKIKPVAEVQLDYSINTSILSTEEQIVENICASIVRESNIKSNLASSVHHSPEKETVSSSEITVPEIDDVPYSPSVPYFSPNSKADFPQKEDQNEVFIPSDSEQQHPSSAGSVHNDSDNYSLSSMSIDSDCDSDFTHSGITTGASFFGEMDISTCVAQSPQPIILPDIPLPGEFIIKEKPAVEIPRFGCFLLPPPPLPTLTITAFDKDIMFMKQFGICKEDFAPRDTPTRDTEKPISSLFNDLCDELTKKDVSNMSAFSQTSLLPSQSKSSEEALSEFEKEIELLLEETTFYDKQPLAQPLIDKASGFPLVGMQYVLEVQKSVQKVDQCSYICSLCSKKMSSDTLIAHVKSVPHRLKFASFHAMDLHSTYGSLELKQWTAALVKEFTSALQKLEAVCGRQQMAVCTEKAVPSAITYLKNKALEALAQLKNENRKSESLKQSVDISSVVASIMEMPKKNVKDINELLPRKRSGGDVSKKPLSSHISRSPTIKRDRRIRTPDRPSGDRLRSPPLKAKPRSPVNRRRSRSPAAKVRAPWADRKYQQRPSRPSNSPVHARKTGGGGSPTRQRRSRSPLSRRQSRSPLSRRMSRSPFGRRQSRSPPLRRRSRSPPDAFSRMARSPMSHKRGGRSPAWGRSPVRQMSPRRVKRSRSPTVSGRNDYDRMKKSKVTRSPDRRQNPGRLSMDEMKKIKDFKAEENELKLNHFAALESYLGEPESHPKYKVEWNIFWERRTKDLRRKGMTPQSYDFTGEWTEYWRKKLTDLCENEFNEKQTQLLIRYNFDKKTLKLLHNNKDMDTLMIKCNETDGAGPHRSERSPSPWEQRPSSNNDRPLYETEFTVYGTLKLLCELEGQLGSLGDSVALLFDQTKELLNRSQNPVGLFDDKDHRVLLKLCLGKLSSLAASGVLDAMSQAKTHMAIEHCNWLQKEIEAAFPEIPTTVAGLHTATVAQSTLGFSRVEIAAYIAKQLMQIGYTQATESDLNCVLSAVSAHHGKINADNLLKEAIFTPAAAANPSPYNPINQIGAPAGNGFEARPALFPSGTNNFPAGTNNFPAGTNNFPVGTNNFPAGTNNYASDTNNFPSDTNNFASGTNNFPAGTNNFASGTNNFASGTNSSIGITLKASPVAHALAPRLAAVEKYSPAKPHQADDKQDEEESSGALSLLITSYEDSVRTIDELSLEELLERLINFSALSSDDQQELTDHLKKLEATDSKRVTKLRTMMRQSTQKKTAQKKAQLAVGSAPSPAAAAKPSVPKVSKDSGPRREIGGDHNTNKSGQGTFDNKPMGTAENAPAKRDDIGGYGEFRYHTQERSYRQEEVGFDAKNNARDSPMSADRLPLQGQGDYPISRAMPVPEAPLERPGYRAYSEEPPSDRPYPGMHPRPSVSRDLGRPGAPRGMVRSDGPPRMARPDSHQGMNRSEGHLAMARPNDHYGAPNSEDYQMIRSDSHPSAMGRSESHRGRGMRARESFRGMSRPETYRGMSRPDGFNRGMGRTEGYRGTSRPTRPWMQSSPADSYSTRPRAPYPGRFGQSQRFAARGRFEGPRRPYDRFN